MSLQIITLTSITYDGKEHIAFTKDPIGERSVTSPLANATSTVLPTQASPHGGVLSVSATKMNELNKFFDIKRILEIKFSRGLYTNLLLLISIYGTGCRIELGKTSLQCGIGHENLQALHSSLLPQPIVIFEKNDFVDFVSKFVKNWSSQLRGVLKRWQTSESTILLPLLLDPNILLAFFTKNKTLEDLFSDLQVKLQNFVDGNEDNKLKMLEILDKVDVFFNDRGFIAANTIAPADLFSNTNFHLSSNATDILPESVNQFDTMIEGWMRKKMIDFAMISSSGKDDLKSICSNFIAELINHIDFIENKISSDIKAIEWIKKNEKSLTVKEKSLFQKLNALYPFEDKTADYSKIEAEYADYEALVKEFIVRIRDLECKKKINPHELVARFAQQVNLSNVSDIMSATTTNKYNNKAGISSEQFKFLTQALNKKRAPAITQLDWLFDLKAPDRIIDFLSVSSQNLMTEVADMNLMGSFIESCKMLYQKATTALKEKNVGIFGNLRNSEISTSAYEVSWSCLTEFCQTKDKASHTLLVDGKINDFIEEFAKKVQVKDSRISAIETILENSNNHFKKLQLVYRKTKSSVTPWEKAVKKSHLVNEKNFFLETEKKLKSLRKERNNYQAVVDQLILAKNIMAFLPSPAVARNSVDLNIKISGLISSYTLRNILGGGFFSQFNRIAFPAKVDKSNVHRLGFTLYLILRTIKENDAELDCFDEVESCKNLAWDCILKSKQEKIINIDSEEEILKFLLTDVVPELKEILRDNNNCNLIDLVVSELPLAKPIALKKFLKMETKPLPILSNYLFAHIIKSQVNCLHSVSKMESIKNLVFEGKYQELVCKCNLERNIDINKWVVKVETVQGCKDHPLKNSIIKKINDYFNGIDFTVINQMINNIMDVNSGAPLFATVGVADFIKPIEKS